MRVRAILLGFYEHLRRKPGTEFDLLSEAAFSPIWMERVEETPAAPPVRVKDSKGRFLAKDDDKET